MKLSFWGKLKYFVRGLLIAALFVAVFGLHMRYVLAAHADDETEITVSGGTLSESADGEPDTVSERTESDNKLTLSEEEKTGEYTAEESCAEKLSDDDIINESDESEDDIPEDEHPDEEENPTEEITAGAESVTRWGLFR